MNRVESIVGKLLIMSNISFLFILSFRKLFKFVKQYFIYDGLTSLIHSQAYKSVTVLSLNIKGWSRLVYIAWYDASLARVSKSKGDHFNHYFIRVGNKRYWKKDMFCLSITNNYNQFSQCKMDRLLRSDSYVLPYQHRRYKNNEN